MIILFINRLLHLLQGNLHLYQNRNLLKQVLILYLRVFLRIFIFCVLRIFLAKQLELLQPHLEAMIPTNKKAFLQQFFSQVNQINSLLFLFHNDQKHLYLLTISIHCFQ